MAESVRKAIEGLPMHERCLRHWHDEEGNDACFRGVPEEQLRGFGYRPTHEPTERIDRSQCEGCKDFVSQYLDFPMRVEDIEKDDLSYDKPIGARHGDLVRVRPCGEEYGGRTYLGVIVADAPTGITVSYDRERETLRVAQSLHNPLIVIPETHSVTWGYDSWWSVIKSPEELREITDGEIGDTWYVLLARGMQSRLEQD